MTSTIVTSRIEILMGNYSILFFYREAGENEATIEQTSTLFINV